MLESIQSFLTLYKPTIKKTRQRIAIVFHAGAENESCELDSFIARLDFSQKLIISPVLENGLLAEKAVVKLGKEYNLVVFDARASFNPDVLGIISGVLCGGGCLLFLLPEITRWKSQQTPYLKRLHGLLKKQPGVFYINDNKRINIPENENFIDEVNAQVVAPYKSLEQQQAVESIDSLLDKNTRCCIVLSSGRGRGKSSLLGLLSARLIEKENYHILITAPRLSVSEPLFYHLQQQNNEGHPSRSSFAYKQSNVSFIAPDLLLDEMPEANVLFIDEAAAIPLSMLSKLLEAYPKIIFSTTTHGYEGTGRGFVLKFYKLLDQLRPEWQKIEMFQPIRWAKDDPVEKWVEEVLLLNLTLDVNPESTAVVKDCQVELLNRDELITSNTKLSSVVSLLVFAHYRTSPADFQYLLDSQDVRIYSLNYKNNVLGVLAINQEGSFTADLSTAIYRGERRPKGHLLAQTLCFHAGFETAASLKFARVMRIAIHPELQQTGLGSYLLQQVIQSEKLIGVDIIGSSFSATPELLRFWNKAQMSLLRLGFSRDHVTAAHSAIVGVGLSQPGKNMIEMISQSFYRNFQLWLTGPLSNLSAEIISYMGNNRVEYSNELNQQDFLDIESFAHFNRNYESCMPAISRWLQSLTLESMPLSAQQQEILQLSLLYKNNWKVIVEKTGLTGKAQVIDLLRSSLKYLLKIKQSDWSHRM